MNSVASAIENTVPISLFNKGMAGKIFQDVKHTGPKVVMKNNSPECVLLSPEEYLQLTELVSDTRLAAVAAERLEHFDSSTLISMEDINRQFGITEEDLEDSDKVEFE